MARHCCGVTLPCLRVSLMMACDCALSPAQQNGSTLRSLFYGPVRREEVRENQLRCGEHSDYGSITLLFQGSEGLQVPPPSLNGGPDALAAATQPAVAFRC